MKKGRMLIKIITLLVLVGSTIIFTGCSSKEEYLMELDRKELQEKIENKDDFLLVYTREGCSHCAEYLPVLENVLTDYKVKGYYIDTAKFSKDDLTYVNSIANISGTPTTVFIENGEETTAVTRIVGTASRNKIVEALKNKGYIE